MSPSKYVVGRLIREVGLSRDASVRIAEKINNLAKTVKWAKPVVRSIEPAPGRITQAQLVREIAGACGVGDGIGKRFLEAYASIAVRETKKSGYFVIPGIGRLVRVERKARMRRNPATGEPIRIPAKKVVKFSVAKVVRDAIVPPKKK